MASAATDNRKPYTPPVVKILDTSASPGSREEIEAYLTGKKSGG